MAQIAQPDEEAKSDMTPMIDVVFLLIVFFICIDFKVLESKLDAWLPTDRGSSSQAAPPKEQLVVRVHVEEPGTEVYGAGKNAGSLDPGTGRPTRFQLKGHSIRLEVGPTACGNFELGKSELERVANDPASIIPDEKTGTRKLMACVVEGFPGTRYDDIARTADLCRAAGFEDIHFGGGLGAR